MIQSIHRFGLVLRRQIYLKSVWLSGLRSQASPALSLRPIGLVALALAAYPPNLIETILATLQWIIPAGLIENHAL